MRRLRETDPGGYLHLIFRVAAPALCAARRDPEPSILERLDPAELAELRRQLEEAVALARGGALVTLPPILA